MIRRNSSNKSSAKKVTSGGSVSGQFQHQEINYKRKKDNFRSQDRDNAGKQHIFIEKNPAKFP